MDNIMELSVKRSQNPEVRSQETEVRRVKKKGEPEAPLLILLN